MRTHTLRDLPINIGDEELLNAHLMLADVAADTVSHPSPS